MTGFSFEALVAELKGYVNTPDPQAAIKAHLQQLVRNPAPLLAASDKLSEPETLFHEDDDLSIWHCRFQPDVMLPPHEHLLPVLIACYSGEELSLLYQSGEAGLDQVGEISAAAGEVIALDRDAIHAVTAHGDRPSEAIHVYLGPLMKLKRDLYDWDTGKAVDFTMEAFEAMKRPV
ncbi:hypothetical protein TRL7639_01024 [Falsiruegeria litorea R37]|uniref:Cysteine dioxygenase type I n=1 Tax=Falsiruegeria litorea R37 TaxID=1200284 RepID=A0A1Y5RWU9_9RHOB|nr:hypothetical protein [Falsiruegeria litorea]SLN27303.1 hypothetical protein TRL7639_01024 [Falsiruegeria litorea R37]